MAQRSGAISDIGDLTPVENSILRYCVSRKDDMIFLVDVTTALADLPTALQGPWFDKKLLTPKQKETHVAVVKDVNRALRRLFKAGFVDIGREDTYPEGFKRRHREIIAARQKDPRWEEGGGDALEAEIRANKIWADVTDIRAAVKQMGDSIELIGLLPEGREFARRVPGTEDS